MSRLGMTRRRALGLCLGAAAGLAAAAPVAAAPPDVGRGASVGELLLRGHGILSRLVLVLSHLGDELAAGREALPEALGAGVDILQRFGQLHQEALEEDFVFPGLAEPGGASLAPLARVLCEQHAVGRDIAARLAGLAVAGLATGPDRMEAVGLLDAFVRMYAPHLAWEGTVVVPAFRAGLGPAGREEMARVFADRERDELGEMGFERILYEVEALERQLGLYDLAAYTPRL